MKLKILMLLQDEDLRPKDLRDKIGLCKVYGPIRTLKELGLIERKTAHCTMYSLTSEGREYLKAGDYSEIMSPTLYVDSLTSFMAENDRPMTAKELHEALQDPRNLYDFRSWLSHLIRRKYIISDKSSRPRRYQITERGREHGANPAAYRSQRNRLQFK
jgi:predicted transcriptional regulator